jgi:4-amino-4-deoxy-L-arabinose transferase-like glycosyltransferase
LLTLVAALLYFSRLDCPLLEPEEGRYAEIPREMLAAGRFAVPVQGGRPYYQKPPLLYWMVMGCYAVCGVDDGIARLVPGAVGLLTVLLVYCWGRYTLGARAALLGALVLCLTPRFVYLGRVLGMDGLLALEVTAALLAACRALDGPRLRRGWWLLSAGATGLGLLTKGPVAAALVVPPVLAAPLLGGTFNRPSARAWLGYLAAALAVAAPWYLSMTWHDPRAAANFFWLHHVLRFTQPFDHARPVWFYLPDVLGAATPWVLLLFLVRRRRAWADRTGRPAVRFFLLAFLWSVAFFSASGCKRAVYIVPALPPLALVLGSCLDRILSLRMAIRLAPVGLLALALLLGWVLLGLPAHHRAYSLREVVQRGQAGLAPGVPVYCYPHRWDSVNFYLQRDDLRIYEPDRLPEMIGSIRAQAEALVFVKAGSAWEELRRSLPASLELSPCGPGAGAIGAYRLCRRGPGNEQGPAIAAGPCREGDAGARQLVMKE